MANSCSEERGLPGLAHGQDPRRARNRGLQLTHRGGIRAGAGTAYASGSNSRRCRSNSEGKKGF